MQLCYQWHWVQLPGGKENNNKYRIKMKNYYKYIIWSLALMCLIACTVEPKPIEYGQDECHFCDMTIMDNKHAAEVVTVKGKVYKFDAIECMVRYTNRTAEQEYAYLLITDFSNPGELIDAQHSTFLISKNLPSPMGAFLTGFSSKESAQLILEDRGGILYNWEDIQAKFK